MEWQYEIISRKLWKHAKHFLTEGQLRETNKTKSVKKQNKQTFYFSIFFSSHPGTFQPSFANRNSLRQLQTVVDVSNKSLLFRWFTGFTHTHARWWQILFFSFAAIDCGLSVCVLAWQRVQPRTPGRSSSGPPAQRHWLLKKNRLLDRSQRSAQSPPSLHPRLS